MPHRPMTILHRKAVKHYHDSRPVRLASVYVQVEDSGGECLTMLLSDDTYYLMILKHIVFFLTLFHMLIASPTTLNKLTTQKIFKY